MRGPERSGDRDAMCAIVEEYAAEKAREEVLHASRQAIIKGFRGGIITKKGAAVMYPKLKAADIDALYQEAKKTTRKKRSAAN